MRAAAMLLAIAIAPAVALAAPPRATWIAQTPPRPPAPSKPSTPPKPPKPPKPPRVIVIKGGPNGRTWAVPTRKRAFLGVQLLPLTNELRGHFGVAEGVGVLISKVEKSTPAAVAGVQVGDVLVAVDGTRVGSARDVLRAIRGKKDGEIAKLEVMRKRKKETLEAKLTVRETPQIDLSGLFQLNPERGELRLEVEGEDIEIPLPPMPQIEELREHILELRKKDEILKHYEKEKNLEKRLHELEEKLRQLEKKLQGKVRKASNMRET